MTGLPQSDPFGSYQKSQPPKGRAVQDNFVNRVVEKCGKAVLRVDTEQKQQLDFGGNSDIFSFFFGTKPDAKEHKVRGHGSGFCIDASGLVLTNAHVVQNADRVTVTFPGTNKPLEAEVLETDEVLDLAALRVRGHSGKTLPSVQMGSSESCRTGDWAIVLGNPLGLNNTCTLGIISSMDRSSGETGFDWMRHPLLQTDAAVNQGNSGGPLLNEVGQVIGIIGMRAMHGEGIGFAIPIDSVKVSLASLAQGKKVPHSYIGVKMKTVDPEVCDSKRLPKGSTGAVIEMVLPNSPAAAAGLEADDIIVEVDRKRVERIDMVQNTVRSAPVGSKMSFRVKRDGKSINANVQTEDVKKLREAASKQKSMPPQRIIIMK